VVVIRLIQTIFKLKFIPNAFINPSIMQHIKIVTINTWKCDGNYRTRIKILATQLKALRPTVIACQECFYSQEMAADTLGFLAQELQMNSHFVEGRSKKRLLDSQWIKSYSGLGILSTFPVAEVAIFNLPNNPDDTDRKIQQVSIALPEENILLVTNTHLTHINHTGLRKKQLNALAEIALLHRTYRYHILCGDFNSPIDSEDLVNFINATATVDCYKAGHGEEPRYSMVNEFMEGKMLCVDHILAIGSNNYCEFINSQVVLNSVDKSTGLYPSDHFGVTTTLVIV
jgi:endonuclease/exonuclease/phosphatase family metal-dependent hydrolase